MGRTKAAVGATAHVVTAGALAGLAMPILLVVTIGFAFIVGVFGAGAAGVFAFLLFWPLDVAFRGGRRGAAVRALLPTAVVVIACAIGAQAQLQPLADPDAESPSSLVIGLWTGVVVALAVLMTRAPAGSAAPQVEE